VANELHGESMSTYICAACGEECDEDPEWSDADALEEYRANFPIEAAQGVEKVRICDDCYQPSMNRLGFARSVN
jgi:hypothetical protein